MKIYESEYLSVKNDTLRFLKGLSQYDDYRFSDELTLHVAVSGPHIILVYHWLIQMRPESRFIARYERLKSFFDAEVVCAP